MAKPKRLLPRAGLHLQRGNEYSHLLKCLFSIFGAEEVTHKLYKINILLSIV